MVTGKLQIAVGLGSQLDYCKYPKRNERDAQLVLVRTIFRPNADQAKIMIPNLGVNYREISL